MTVLKIDYDAFSENNGTEGDVAEGEQLEINLTEDETDLIVACMYYYQNYLYEIYNFPPFGVALEDHKIRADDIEKILSKFPLD